MTRALFVSSVLVVGLSCVACKDDQACEQSRLEVARTWRKVKETAGARALPEEEAKLSEAQKAERKRLWTGLQEHAYLVEGSLKTTQITWRAAEKGRADLRAAYAQVPNKDDPLVGGFGRILDDADQKYERFKENCR